MYFCSQLKIVYVCKRQECQSQIGQRAVSVLLNKVYQIYSYHELLDFVPHESSFRQKILIIEREATRNMQSPSIRTCCCYILSSTTKPAYLFSLICRLIFRKIIRFALSINPRQRISSATHFSRNNDAPYTQSTANLTVILNDC